MVVIGSVHLGEEGVAEPKGVGFEPGRSRCCDGYLLLSSSCQDQPQRGCAAVGTSIWDLVLTTDLMRLDRYCCCFKLGMTEYSQMSESLW